MSDDFGHWQYLVDVWTGKKNRVGILVWALATPQQRIDLMDGFASWMGYPPEPVEGLVECPPFD